MDAAALFETTVLHEMTHSKAVEIQQWDMGIGEVYGSLGIVDVPSPNNSGMWSLSSRLSSPRYSLIQRRSRHKRVGEICVNSDWQDKRVGQILWHSLHLQYISYHTSLPRIKNWSADGNQFGTLSF